MVPASDFRAGLVFLLFSKMGHRALNPIQDLVEVFAQVGGEES